MKRRNQWWTPLRRLVELIADGGLGPHLRGARKASFGLFMVSLAILTAAGALFASPSAAEDESPTTTQPDGGAGTEPAAGRQAPAGTPSCPADLNAVNATESEVRIVIVKGLIDPVMKNYILTQLSLAEENDALAVVLLLDSKDSVISDTEYVELATRLKETDVTVAIWVGEAGASALGGAAELLGVADVVGMAPKAKLGKTGPARLGPSFEPAFGELTRKLETDVIGPQEAIDEGLSAGPLQNVAVLPSFLNEIPGYETFECATEQNLLVTLPQSKNEFTKPSFVHQLFHNIASPEIAYLFFAAGLWLLLFELFTAGVGVAGILGAGLTILGSYGLAILPTNWWAIALILLSVLFLAVDVQTNVPGVYTIAGLVAFALATWFLYDGLRMSWVTAIIVLVSAVLYAYVGMPSMVRTRFSTPTIGRKWMIGATGIAEEAINPEGTVSINGAKWRAIVNRATPIQAGDQVKVTGLNRLLLEVEPPEGAAKDYRDRGGPSDEEE